MGPAAFGIVSLQMALTVVDGSNTCSFIIVSTSAMLRVEGERVEGRARSEVRPQELAQGTLVAHRHVLRRAIS